MAKLFGIEIANFKENRHEMHYEGDVLYNDIVLGRWTSDERNGLDCANDATYSFDINKLADALKEYRDSVYCPKDIFNDCSTLEEKIDCMLNTLVSLNSYEKDY